MVTQSDEMRDLHALAAASGQKTFFPPSAGEPNVKLGQRPLAAGFFIMSGPTATGKSTNSLALALELGLPYGMLNYVYVLEPRASGPYSERFENSALMHETVDNMFRAYASTGSPYLVIDSMTYVIPAIGAHALEGQDDVTMTGGLRRSEILGVLGLDMRARKAGLTVIGTINSELFPRPDALKGACEGQFLIEAPGKLMLSDRTERGSTPITLQATSIAVARALLGQSTLGPSNTYDKAFI